MAKNKWSQGIGWALDTDTSLFNMLWVCAFFNGCWLAWTVLPKRKSGSFQALAVAVFLMYLSLELIACNTVYGQVGRGDVRVAFVCAVCARVEVSSGQQLHVASTSLDGVAYLLVEDMCATPASPSIAFESQRIASHPNLRNRSGRPSSHPSLRGS